MTNTLRVTHNMEVAHRLSLLPGKCQNIHGHSMQVHLIIQGLPLNENGIAGGVDFGDLKKAFRSYIDASFDHHLVLNIDDPYAGVLVQLKDTDKYGRLPGLVTTAGDPTVENLSQWICKHMATKVWEMSANQPFDIEVSIEETKTNGASWKMSIGVNGEGI